MNNLEIRYKRFFDTAQDGIIIINADSGEIIDVNPFLLNLVGYTYEQFIGKHLWEVRVFINIVQSKEEFSVLQTNEYIQYDNLLLLSSDNKLIEVEFISNLYIENFTTIIQCTIRDVSDRKIIEVQLDESVQLMHHLFDNMSNGIAIYKAVDNGNDFVFVSMNRTGQLFSGIDINKVKGKSLRLTFPSVEKIGLLAKLRDTWLTGNSNHLPLILYEDTRIKQWVENYIFKLPSGFVVALYADTSETKRLEELRKKSEEKFNKAFHNSPTIIIITRLSDGMILDVNNTFITVTGYTREEICNKSTIDLNLWVNFEDRNQCISIMDRKGSVKNYETKFNMKDRVITATFSGELVEIDNELCVLSVILDISEYKELELRAQRAEKLEVLGTLAGGVAHDLNNVLGIIVGYTELLKYEVTATEIITEYLENIRNAGEKASTIVQDLLTLTRRSVYARKIVNMNKVIETCCKSPEFLKFKELHTATIKFELHPKLLNILGSPLHLEKSIMNLLTNAMESNSSEIIIETTNQYIDVPLIGYDEIKEGDYVIITIKDNGDGIKKEDLVRIFEPFYTSKIMGKSGTGLGLSIVWGSIKDHEGYINVTSEPHNTIFYLYLPVTRETELAEEIYTQVEYKGNGESILVIDDILAQRELATLMLRKLNYKVESVASGELAIEYLQRNNVDLIVLDMVMEPGMNGVDTFVEIKKINPKQKSIIVSGYSQTNEVLHIQSLGAGAYIKKPYRIEKIGTAIKYELTKAI